MLSLEGEVMVEGKTEGDEDSDIRLKYIDKRLESWRLTPSTSNGTSMHAFASIVTIPATLPEIRKKELGISIRRRSSFCASILL